MGGEVGVVYLLHFNRPYRHARHYTGWTANLEQRLAAHRNGDLNTHHRLMLVIHAAGIGFTLARTWDDVDRKFEKQLKRRGGASRHCPVCKAEGWRRHVRRMKMEANRG